MHVAIIGNGITGISAALRLRQREPGWRISVISGESTHHYSRPALMYIYMGHVRYQDTKPYEDHFWPAQRIELVRDWVTRVDCERRKLELHRAGALEWDKLLIATGSKSNKFGWPGQDLRGVQGLYSLMDLKALYDHTPGTRRAVIVGGGLIGIELAEMLHSRGIPVTFLVREDSYWSNVLPAEESAMVGRVIRGAGIELKLGTELASILGDGQGGGGRARAVVTKGGETIECQLVGLTAGVSPNVDLVRGTSIAVGRGIKVDAALRTNVPGVWAAGDCAEVTLADGRSLVQQVWYTGKEQGEVAADSMAGDERRHEPGVWYNSAKFLDLEYQVYGRIGTQLPGERTLYWEHADGRRSVRIAYTREGGGGVVGFNLMGVRYRHRVCERWIRERRPIDWVLEHLGEANFDPEFYARHEREIAAAFRRNVQ
jgi:NADPH-dependent 2,4-dienoyl-CoA reductase/sulfur reductase-like enzyme